MLNILLQAAVHAHQVDAMKQATGRSLRRWRLRLVLRRSWGQWNRYLMARVFMETIRKQNSRFESTHCKLKKGHEQRLESVMKHLELTVQVSCAWGLFFSAPRFEAGQFVNANHDHHYTRHLRRLMASTLRC